MDKLRKEVDKYGVPNVIGELTPAQFIVYVRYGMPLIIDGDLVISRMANLDKISIIISLSEINHINSDGLTILEQRIRDNKINDVVLLLTYGADRTGIRSDNALINNILNEYKYVISDNFNIYTILEEIDNEHSKLDTKPNMYRKNRFVNALASSEIDSDYPTV